MDFTESFFKIMIQVPIIISGLLLFWAGLKTINFFSKKYLKYIEKKYEDPYVYKFLCDAATFSVKVLLITVLLGFIGVNTESISVFLGTAFFAIVSSFKIMLKNLAGGIIIFTTRPFKTGDFIESGEYIGEVTEINFLNTKLVVDDNRTAILSNSDLTENPMINLSATETKRRDIKFRIPADRDHEKVRRILLDTAEKCDKVLKSSPHEPQVLIYKLENGFTHLYLRFWVKSWHIKASYNEIMEISYPLLQKADLIVPRQQRDFHSDYNFV